MTEKNRGSKRKQKDQENFFIGLPRWLFESKIISIKEKIFLLVLSDHRNSKTKRCDPGVPLICQEMQLCHVIVKKIREKLRKIGIITHIPGKGGKNHAQYSLNWLDGSDIEIARLKSILSPKQPVKKLYQSNRPTSKETLPVTSKETLPVTSKETLHKQHHKETTKENNNNREELAAVSSLSFSREKDRILTMFSDTGWETLSIDHISKLISIALLKGKRDSWKYFRLWKREIDKKKNIHNKPGYLTRTVEEGNDPPGYQEFKEEDKKWGFGLD